LYFSRVSGKLDYSRAQSSEMMGLRTYQQLVDNVMRKVRKKKIIWNYLKNSCNLIAGN